MKYTEHEIFMNKMKTLANEIDDAEYRSIALKHIQSIGFDTRNLMEYKDEPFGHYEEYKRMIEFVTANLELIGNQFTIQTWKGISSKSTTITIYLRRIQMTFKTHNQKFADDIINLLESYKDKDREE